MKLLVHQEFTDTEEKTTFLLKIHTDLYPMDTLQMQQKVLQTILSVKNGLLSIGGMTHISQMEDFQR
nr:MAG TPA: hypothetical protein [Caudoviricetes sp.]